MNMVKQKPEAGKELKLEVKGYSCNDDCKEYLPKKNATNGCGWQPTAKDTALW